MKLLLHICCAPCSAAIVGNLLEKPDIELEGYFYNPNIHPEEELIKRKMAVAAMAGDLRLPVIYDDSCMMDYWQNALSENKQSRCRVCYSLRLVRAAQYAHDHGFDAFTTSLLISPWQDHELIRELGEQAASKYQLQFYYEDFRPLYRRGREIARGKSWYMQKFCGCFYSFSESTHPKKPIYFV